MKMLELLHIILLWSITIVYSNADTPFPVILWHGMGDSCCNPLSMGRIKTMIEENAANDIYVKPLRIGNNIIEDIENGFTMNANLQVEDVCEQIANDEKLQRGYNAIGFSQGAQFLRAVAQRCPTPPMNNLISIGGQHQGVFGLPYCTHTNKTVCEFIRKIITHGAYWSLVQNKFVQAQYWHDPLKENEYIHKSLFLADINNEREINFDYRKNLMELNKLVLVMFEDDHMVIPKESSWFGYYPPGQDKVITKMEDSVLYQVDRIGLKYLNENNRLDFLSLPGDHLSFSEKWFIENVINKYL